MYAKIHKSTECMYKCRLSYIYTHIYVYIYIYVKILTKVHLKDNGYLISQVSFLRSPRLELQEALERVPITVEPGCLRGLTNQPPGGPTNLQPGCRVPLVDAAQVWKSRAGSVETASHGLQVATRFLFWGLGISEGRVTKLGAGRFVGLNLFEIGNDMIIYDPNHSQRFRVLVP